VDYKGWKVPEVLTSGNFAKLINGGKMRLMNTQKRRPDLLKNKENSFKASISAPRNFIQNKLKL
jgi:tRNA G37 N-methylase TrmD